MIEQRCSFCGKAKSEVRHLLVSPDGKSFICDECVELCKDYLKEFQRQREEMKKAYYRRRRSKLSLTNMLSGRKGQKRYFR